MSSCMNAVATSNRVGAPVGVVSLSVNWPCNFKAMLCDLYNDDNIILSSINYKRHDINRYCTSLDARINSIIVSIRHIYFFIAF